MLALVLAALAPPTFEVRERIPLPGDEAWGRPAFHKPSHRLFVPRDGRVQIVDLESKKVIVEVVDVPGTRAIAIVPERDLAFATTPQGVLVFDLTNGAEIKRIPLADDPDDIAYDPRTRRVFVAHRNAPALTPIDISALVAQPRVALGGTPQGFVIADRGLAYAAERDAIERIDLGKGRVEGRWSQKASALAYDGRRNLLYALQDDSMAILDAKRGTPQGTVSLGKGPHSLLADFELGLAFGANSDGTLTVVHAKSATVVQTLTTAPGATEAAIDPDDHRLYLLAKEDGKLNVLVTARAKGH